MNKLLKTCGTALALTALLTLTACGGGGNDDDPTPSEQTGVLTVTDSTVGGLDGLYGNGTLNLTDVDKKNPIGSDPEVCTFKFDGAGRVLGDGTASGDVRYQPNAGTLYLIFFTVNNREFGSDLGVDTEVQRGRDRVQLDRKLLTARDGSGATIRVSGFIPMRVGRPSGC